MKWVVGFVGLRFGYRAVATTLERPRAIGWESTTGLKLRGRARFDAVEPAPGPRRGGGDGRRATRVTLRLGFAAPRVASVLFRRSSAIAPFVENRVLAPTLARFRDTLAEMSDGERGAP